ncbi:zwei Ig domain protein zig-3 [Cherax quadricarinatus]|uniref:zwei Ig domain protein zig-3 n=1 Tax=Cherax quadricarinatus TaxID=27406 RepID=UPI00387E6918
MMRTYILLGYVLVTIPSIPATPVHRQPHQQHTNTGSPGVPEEVFWGKQCSPRQVIVRLQQDTVLQCEVFAPTGTVLTWYKDHTLLDGKMGTVQESISSLERSTAKVHLSSVVYIDCASFEDQGEYHLEVRSPSHQVYSRYFTVNLTENEDLPGRTCWISTESMRLIPRIYQYARQAIGEPGNDVLLPCRLRGHLNSMSTTWLFKDTQVTSRHAKYKVLASGDLLVRSLRPEDRGVYTCQAYSNKLPGFIDQVHTFVYPLD